MSVDRRVALCRRLRYRAMRIVAIEEHHVLPGLPLLPGLGTSSDSAWPPAEVRQRLYASVDRRLADMDAARIDRQVLSVPLTIAEDLPDDSLRSMATTANSELQGMVEKYPHRFAAFATLPCSTPDLAAAELERAVTQLGFVGAMIYGNVGGRFLDDPMFGPILDAAERLDVPIYLHPGPPPKRVRDAYYSGFDPAINLMLANGAYGWHYEASLHATRMVIAGVFDRHPGLKMILGHLGEGIPFHLARIDDVLTPLASHLRKPISAYYRDNFWVTTSGYFYTGPFELTRETFGDDHVIFSVDYPFADNRRALDWFDHLDLAPDEREKIAHANAEALLRLPGLAPDEREKIAHANAEALLRLPG
jgi:uncharacterized protein